MGFLNDVRTVVDPLLLRLKEELYGSGISYGRISTNVLPTTVVYETNITQILDAEGYFVDPTTTNGDMIVRSGGAVRRLPSGSDGKYLSVIGGIPAWVNAPSGTDPTIAEGDIIYRRSSTTRLAIGTSGQVLTVVSGYPEWASIPTGFTNPMTTAGDIIYGTTAGAAVRLPIGTSGQLLMVVGGVPTWATLDTSGSTVSGIDVYGILPSGLVVKGLQTYPIAATMPASGDRLRFNGVSWEPSNKIWQPLTNGDPDAPELIFAGGDVIMVEV